jgi:predicted nucleic acid-binding Zn ribbon protein
MPIYTYRCKKCLEEFDAQHAMNQTYLIHSDNNESKCDGTVQRAQYIAVTTGYTSNRDGVDLEYRVRQVIEEDKEELKKDASKRMSVDTKKIQENIKNGN